MRLTVGPLPPAVYWRRRALVLGAALLVLFLIAQACMVSAPADDRTSRADPSPTASATPAATSTATPAATGPDPGEDGDGAPAGSDEEVSGDDRAADDSSLCDDDEILVTAEASRTEFAQGSTSEFTIRIAHDSDRECRRDVGGDQRELWLVRGSGADHVWSSRHCDPPEGSQVVDMAPGLERDHRITFVGRSSSECDGPAATGPELEAGEYQLYARLGTARSEPLTITIN